MIRGAAAALALFAALAPSPAAEERPDDVAWRPGAGGEISWVFGGDVDLLGDLWVNLPFAVDDDKAVFFSLDTRTVISLADSGFKFLVHELDYDAQVGLRIGRVDRGRILVLVGQQGQEWVDADRGAYVRYAGFGWENRAFGREDRIHRWTWHVEGGPTLMNEGVESDLYLRGEVHYRRYPRGFDWGIDLTYDGLIVFSDFDHGAEIRVGPRFGFTLAGNRRADLFVHWLSGNHPLGVDLDAALVGLDLSQAFLGEPSAAEPPAVGGMVEAGGGDGRPAGRLMLRFLTPSFAKRWRGSLEFDANVLGGEDVDELYYFYHLGVERTVGAAGSLAGAYYRHRSSHTIGADNDSVPSFDSLEAGYESARWDRPPETEGAPGWGRLDWRLRAGYLLNADFGGSADWQAFAGARWVSPWPRRRFHPFVSGLVERGDAERDAFAAGVFHASGAGLKVEYRRDDAYLGEDETAWLGLLGFGF
jgi:hypothetical protein